MTTLDLRPDAMRISEAGVLEYNWPLNQREMQQLGADLTVTLAKTLRDIYDPDDIDARMLMLYSSRLLTDLCALAFAELLFSRVENKVENVILPENASFPRLVFLGEKISDYVTKRRLENGLKKPAGQNSWRAMLRPIKSFLVRDGFSRNSIQDIDLENDIVTVSVQSLICSLLPETQSRVNILPLSQWFGPVTQEDREAVASTAFNKDHCAKVWQAFDTCLRQYGAGSGPNSKYFLENEVPLICNWIRFHWQKLLAKPDRIPKRLWAGSSGIIWIRILQDAVKYCGGEVTGFDHAEAANFCANPHFAFTELQTVDKFVTYSRGQAKSLESVYELYAITNNKPSITYPQKALRATLPKCRLAKGAQPKRILVLPLFVHTSENYPHALPYPMPAFDWYCRLLNMLGKRYEVWFKPHPLMPIDYPAEFANFQNVTVISTGKSTDLFPEVDAVLFDTPLQTTFGQAMLTDIPIILLNAGYGERHGEQQAVVEKRCGLADINIDAQNRWQISETELYCAIEDAAKKRYSKELLEYCFADEQNSAAKG